MVTIVTGAVNPAGAGYDLRMGLGRHLDRVEQLELAPTRDVRFTLVVYRAAADGPEVFLVRARKRWALPVGVSRLAETPQHASERFLREEWGANLATFEVEVEVEGEGAETAFAAEAEAGDSGYATRIQADGEWFGIGKVRALALGADGLIIESLMRSLE